MSEAERSIALLKRENNLGYGLKELPSQRDDELRALIESSTPAELAPAIRHDMHPVLRVFAERAASLAVRTGDASWLKIGLVALTLADLESRESLLILPLYVDSARGLNFETRLLFGTVGNLFGGAAANSLQAFLGRSPQDRSLDSMGYSSEGEGRNFRYKRTW